MRESPPPLIVFSRKTREERDYWLKRLSTIGLRAEVRSDRPRRPDRLASKGRTQFTIDGDLHQKLLKLTSAGPFLIYTALLSALKVCLYKLTGDDRIVVGSPARRAEEESRGVGNALAIVDDLDDALPFRQFLLNVRESLSAAYARQDYPFERLVKDLSAEKVDGRCPLFDVALAFEAIHADMPDVNQDMTITLRKEADRLAGSVEFDSTLFDASTIEHLTQAWLHVLRSALSDVNAPLAGLQAVTPDEQHRLLIEWNDTHAPYPRDARFHELFEAQAARAPEAVAIVLDEAQITYGALNRRANQLARHLRKLGVGPEVLVGVCLERSLEMIVGLLGILKAGGAYVPLDPAYPKERLRWILNDTRLPVLLTRPPWADDLPAPDVHVIDLTNHWADIGREPADNVIGEATAQNLAYVIYTSGSTGNPKGTLLSHQGLCNVTEAQLRTFDLTPRDRALQFASPSFDASIFEMVMALRHGATLCLVPEERRLPGADLLQLLRDEHVTLMTITPSALAAVPFEPLPALRIINVAGEACPADLVARWAEGRRFFNLYGPTEGTIWTTTAECLADDRKPPIGKPIDNVQVYVLDARLQPVPVGAPGELCIGGVGLARGYLNRPDLTAEKFIPNPFTAAISPPSETGGDTGGGGGRLYLTGDRVRYLPDGNIEFVGRIDHQVKLRGFRIEMGEVESVLKQHASVQEALVVALDAGRNGASESPDDPDSKRLVAYVLPQPTVQASEEQVKDWAVEQVAAWQKLYDDLHRQPVIPADPTFNTQGWNSSYTGLPLPETDMREWVTHTTDVILSLRPQRVLEVGCGTGLLLFRIAPRCAAYWGVDFSRESLNYLERALGHQALPQVQLSQRLADDWQGIEPESFDAVVLNSVIQYFPGTEYLLRVLDSAVKSVASGGFVFLGDVRSLGLLEAFHASVELEQASSTMPLAEFRQRVRRGIAQEKELVIDPAFFVALRGRLPRITHVAIRPRRGYADNELTRFRYDVLLYVERPIEYRFEHLWLNWQDGETTLSKIRKVLVESNPAALGITNVPNGRVVSHVRAAELLRQGDPAATLLDALDMLPNSKATGVQPEEWWEVGRELGYAVEISWPRAGACYDVAFRRLAGQGARDVSSFPLLAEPARAWEDYANNPVQGIVQRELIPQLRAFLKERLPIYMLPATFVMLEALPLTPSGKVDRRALPAPDGQRPELSKTFVAPRNSSEERLADIWAQVLGLERVGVNDNFFELGGHSLLAVQLMSRIREAFRQELPLQALFKSPSVAGLAVELAHSRNGQVGDPTSAPALPSIEPNRAEKYQPFPLTDIQQAYWVGRGGDFELSGVATHAYLEIETLGLDLERFEQALHRWIARHDMLRVVVLADGRQQILEHVPPYRIDVLDLRGQDAESVASQLAAIRATMSHQIIPSDRWPLFEIRASRLNARHTRLHVSIDALIGDAWSWQILRRELSQLYENLEAPLPPLDISFRDYVLAELALRDSDLYQRSLDYWRDRLPTLPPPPDLPLAASPASLTQPRFVRHGSRLEPAIWQRLKARITQADLTTSTALLAAFAEVLSVWSKSPRFTINLTLFNRLPLHPQVNDLVGDFTSLTLLEVDCSRQEGFESRAKRLQEQLWQDLDHRYVSGVNVLRDLARTQERIGKAMMPVVFTSVINPMPQAEVEELPSAEIEESNDLSSLADPAYSISQTSQVWLDHQVSEQGGGLIFNWDVVEALFPAGLLDDMFQAYCHLLHTLALEETAWQATTQQLIPLPASQLRQRASINATAALRSAELLHTLFAAQVSRRPAQAAVIAPDRTLSYAELHSHSNRIGRWLRDNGARPNTLVAVVMEKGWEQIVAVLGILQSGAAYLPIDAHLPTERIAYLLENGEVEFVLTQAWLDEDLTWPEKCRRLCVDGDQSADVSDQPLEPIQQPTDLAYVIYTSGSTGQPKGVMIDHRGAVNTVLDINRRFGVGAQDRVLALSALSFDLSVYDIFGLLAAGGTLVVPQATAWRDPAHWADVMAHEHVTLWNSVPALMEMLVEYLADRESALPASLRLAMLSGDWIPVTLPDRMRALKDDLQIVSLGGATEASIWSILYPIAHVDPNWKSIPYGHPMANQSFHVLDDALEPRPIWVPGQLYIGGIGLAQGYWHDEVKTRAKFIVHPRTGERLYATGDLGRYLPDGEIEFLGREDLQVKVQGYRIELGEIESILAQYPLVRASVVTAVGEPGEGKRLVAYVVPGSESTFEVDDLRQFLQARLPDYMMPMAFVALETLPLTPNGKVDRRALPAPREARLALAEACVPPRTPVEAEVAGIWAEVLELDQVGVYDNFFELGGHSLLAIQIISRVQQVYQVELPLRRLFETPTVAGLAEMIGCAERVELVPLLSTTIEEGEL